MEVSTILHVRLSRERGNPAAVLLFEHALLNDGDPRGVSPEIISNIPTKTPVTAPFAAR